jgi:hypothetical protein
MNIQMPILPIDVLTIILEYSIESWGDIMALMRTSKDLYIATKRALGGQNGHIVLNRIIHCAQLGGLSRYRMKYIYLITKFHLEVLGHNKTKSIGYDPDAARVILAASLPNCMQLDAQSWMLEKINCPNIDIFIGLTVWIIESRPLLDSYMEYSPLFLDLIRKNKVELAINMWTKWGNLVRRKNKVHRYLLAVIYEYLAKYGQSPAIFAIYRPVCANWKVRAIIKDESAESIMTCIIDRYAKGIFNYDLYSRIIFRASMAKPGPLIDYFNANKGKYDVTLFKKKFNMV